VQQENMEAREPLEFVQIHQGKQVFIKNLKTIDLYGIQRVIA